ncbi:MAG: hypothetical protein V1742_00155 [Pseudomonadota bacterium]
MAAGHTLADLKDGYTIDQVQLFARALSFNREQEKLDQAEAVALGISEAFAPEQNLLGRLRQELVNPEAIDGGRDAHPTAQLKPEIMASLFGGLPLAE